MNKSRVARDLYRKVFNDNLINLSDGDARKQIVREFLNDPVNKKAGWHQKDARFFRLAFQKVAKENNFNVMSINMTPTPSRSKTQKGTMNINVKSKQKNPTPMMDAIKPPTEEQKKFGARYGETKLKELKKFLKGQNPASIKKFLAEKLEIAKMNLQAQIPSRFESEMTLLEEEVENYFN